MNSKWEIKHLDNLCIIKGRIGYRGYTKQDLVKKGEGAITLSPSNIINNKLLFDKCSFISWKKYFESPEIMIEQNDIIFCKTASIGKLALVDKLPEKATINPQFVVLKNISCNRKFLYYYLQSNELISDLEHITGGTAVPTVSQKNLGNLSIPVPPLPEQQHIVNILDKAFDAIDKAIANTEKNLQNAKDLFQSKLKEIFNSKNERWNRKKLVEISDKITDGSHNPPKGISKSDYLMLSSRNVFNDKILFDAPRYLTKASYELEDKRTQITEGDVLLTIVGTIGRVAVVSNENKQFTLQRSVAVITPNKTICSRFLMYYLISINKELSEKARGVAQKGIYLNQIKNLLITYPEIIEQKRIVQELDSLSQHVDLLLELMEKKMIELGKIKKSILQKAFSGELTN